ncbi:MAG TPA: hypothetical protein ENJ95_15570 [Bacteroidetes bacterium]|nr:hypothetical protein [Bacteroidota bacterium]
MNTNSLLAALKKIVQIFEGEEIPYMVVGGFALSYYNRARTTNDIDINIQVYPNQIEKIVQHFPEWMPSIDTFRDNAEKGIVFNIFDFDSGVKYDFMVYKDSDYNWTAFERRKAVDYMGVKCMIASAEDLVISKLIWYNISKSEKQWGDLNFLMTLPDLDMQYLQLWAIKLFIKRHGLF